MSKVKITIDPGHGGNDRWNRGPTGYIEADGVLEISLYLRDYLMKSGRFDVTMTRTRDRSLTLQERTDIAVRNNADMLLSIHTNGFNGQARGPEVWISRHETRRDGPMGREITKLISEEYNVPNRGIKNRVGGSGYNDFHGMIRLPYLATNGKMRPYIVEALFHDNRQDEAILKKSENLKRIAELIAKAVYKEYSVPWVEEKPSTDKVLWYGEVLSRTLNVRERPTTNSDIVDTLDRGDKVSVYLETGTEPFKWLYIDGGYVSNARGEYVGLWSEEEKEVKNAILIYSFADFPVAETLANRLKAPIYLRGSEDEIKADTVYVIGGGKPKVSGKVVMLSGSNRFETAAEVGKYINNL